MGLESRLAVEIALNVQMDTLLDPDAARARLIAGAEQRIGQIGADHRVIGPHRLGAAQRRHRLIERATVAGNRAAERKQRHIVGA